MASDNLPDDRPVSRSNWLTWVLAGVLLLVVGVAGYVAWELYSNPIFAPLDAPPLPAGKRGP